jgi:hypothetical protein
VVVTALAAIVLAGCGSSAAGSGSGGGSPAGASGGSAAPAASVPHAHPQAIEPAAGVAGPAIADGTPVGDVNAHAPSLQQIKSELRLELVAARVTSTAYVDPLQFVTVWERTDQGVDAQMPVGAPILAPGRIKILAIEANWYAGQPLVYYELLDGPDAGQVQYVAEQITSIAAPGSILTRGQPIARYAASGTSIEFGWSTINGVTLARATTGYEEGQVTPAGRSIRAWLNSLGANAGAA